MDKMCGPISAITLHTATYSGCSIEANYLNFFYGRNGAGKSTIARAIGERGDLDWKTGVNPDDHHIMVYDKAFVDDNFATYDSLGGVFTVGQANIEAEEQLATLRRDRAEQDKTAERQRAEVAACQSKQEELTQQFHETCWTKSKEVRERFAHTQEGKKQKRTFAEAILAATTAVEQDLDELNSLYDVAFDKQAVTYPRLRQLTLQLPDVGLMGTAIVSTANSDFATFIQTLNAADWVRHGHNTFEPHDGDPCPFCQQQLPVGFTARLAECFDDAYERSIAALTTFADEYKRVARHAWDIPASTKMTTVPPQLAAKEYDTALELLRAKLQANVELIDRKLANPSSQHTLEDHTEALENLNAIIDATNEAIDAHNKVVADQKQQRTTCKERVWQHLAAQLKTVVTTYRKQTSALSDNITKAKTAERAALDKIKNLDAEIKQVKGSVVDTTVVMERINDVLKESGFQGFSFAEVPDAANTYRVVRPDGATAENLSEGERNFIAFLYFYFLVHGSLDQDATTGSKIVVIDDPVSSMDSNAMFIVAAHVRELISICQNNAEYRHDRGQGDFIKQIFVLSHNPYFFREVSYPNLNDYSYANYYLITKCDNVSTVKCCVRARSDAPSQQENYSPVLNTYTALWREYKEAASSITLLNVTRRILEHYFLQLCGYDGADLSNTLLKDNRSQFIHTDADGREDLSRYHLVTAMLTYISHHKHGIGDDAYLVDEDYDPAQLRHVFQTIFTLMGQGQHYRMMAGADGELDEAAGAEE